MKEVALRHLLLLRAQSLTGSDPQFAEAITSLGVSQTGPNFHISWQCDGKSYALDWPSGDLILYLRGDTATGKRTEDSRWSNWGAARRIWQAVADRSGFSIEEEDASRRDPLADGGVCRWPIAITVLAIAAAAVFAGTWPRALEVILAGFGIVLGAAWLRLSLGPISGASLPLASLAVWAVVLLPHETARPAAVALGIGLLAVCGNARSLPHWAGYVGQAAAGGILGVAAGKEALWSPIVAGSTLLCLVLTGVMFRFTGLLRGSLVALVSFGLAAIFVGGMVSWPTGSGAPVPLNGVVTGLVAGAAMALAGHQFFRLFVCGILSERPATPAIVLSLFVGAALLLLSPSSDLMVFSCLAIGFLAPGLEFVWSRVG